MLFVAALDLYRKGREATKFREYGFVLLAGAIGAAAGLVNDLITSSISPDYFILGKGLEDGPGFRMQVAIFGLIVGLAAMLFRTFKERRRSVNRPIEG